MGKKICFILLTLSFFASRTFALTSQEEQTLRNLLGDLKEINRMDAQRLEELERQLQESQRQSQELSRQLELCSSQMQRQEQSLARWKTFSIVGASATVTLSLVVAGLIIWRCAE